MTMTEEFWLRDGWEIPGSDDEMEYDLTKCVDSKLTACFEMLKRQKTLKLSPGMCGRPVLSSYLAEFGAPAKDQGMNKEPNKPPDNNDGAIFDAFDYHEDKNSDNARKRAYPSGAGSGRQQVSKKATLNNALNNMKRHMRLENMGAKPQMIKNNMYGAQGAEQFQPQNIRHPIRSASVHDITQNVMAQSRSINESMASLNMPPRKNMPMTTPQPTPLGQPMSQGVEMPRPPNISSPNTPYNTMAHMSGPRMVPPNQTMMSNNMLIRGMVPDQRGNQPVHYPMGTMSDPMQQQQQQMYQRMASGGMYSGPHGLTLVQGNNMSGPRMLYNGQPIMTTQHSGPGNMINQNGAVLVSRSGGMMGSSMIPGMGPAPPNMSAANMVQNQQSGGPGMNMGQKMMGDNCQIVVSQAMHPGVMMNNQSVVPNQTIGSFPPHPIGHPGMSQHMGRGGPGTPNILSPDNKTKQMKMPVSSTGNTGPVMMPPPSPASMVSPTGNRTPQRTPPANTSPTTTDRDNITLNTAVADPEDP